MVYLSVETNKQTFKGPFFNRITESVCKNSVSLPSAHYKMHNSVFSVDPVATCNSADNAHSAYPHFRCNKNNESSPKQNKVL